jgi:hypothetical protein
MKLPRAKPPARSDLEVILLRSYYRERMIAYLKSRLPRLGNMPDQYVHGEVSKIVDHLLEILNEAESKIGRGVPDATVGRQRTAGLLHSASARP